MHDSHFQLLLHAARSQPDPQRLLFVFAAAVLPSDASAAQRLQFDEGDGGELTPVMCVDKDPHTLTTFEALNAESLHTGNAWQVLFVAGLSGMKMTLPSESQIARALDEMVESVRQGSIDRYAAYDVRGEPLSFT
ncbi:MAG: ribonucleotide reductase subunit alpha [Casimicrobiaceae bacterium]